MALHQIYSLSRTALSNSYHSEVSHDDVIKWNVFSRYWIFLRGIHRSPANSPHKGRWHRALVFSLICAWMNVWVNKREALLRRYGAHYDVTVMRIHVYFLLPGIQPCECLNGGVCRDPQYPRQCECRTGFYGTLCESRKYQSYLLICFYSATHPFVNAEYIW